MTFLDFSKRKSIAIIISFLITVGLSRLIVFFIENKIASSFFKYNIIGEYHIHHFTYGIIILSIIGYVSLFISNRFNKTWIFIIYGIGLGLVFDEFGLWLKLEPLYDQIVSIVAIILISIFLIISAFIEHKYRVKHTKRKINNY
ncbi:MAG: hypothetical protein WCJ19_02490 [bacterium]